MLIVEDSKKMRLFDQKIYINLVILKIQLQNFASGARENDSAAVMRMIAEKLTDTEMNAVTDYIQGLQ